MTSFRDKHLMGSAQEGNHNLRNWALFIGGALLVFINFKTSLTLIPQYVYEIGGSAFQAGLQNTLFVVTAVLLRFYTGPFTDRKGKKLALLIGALTFATTPLILLAATSVWMIYVSRIYQSLGLAIFLPAGSSLVADMSPEGKTGAYMGMYRMVITFAVLLGPYTGSHLIGRFDFTAWFWVSIFIGMLSVVLLGLLQPPAQQGGKFEKKEFRVENAGTEENGEENNKASFLKITGNQSVRLIFFCLALVATAYGTILTHALTFIEQNAPDISSSTYFLCFGLGGVLANVFIGRWSDKWGRLTVAWPVLMLMGSGVLLLLLTSLDLWMVTVISGFITGTGYFGSTLVLVTWLTDVVEGKLRATGLGMMDNIIDIFIGTGSLMLVITGSLFNSFLVSGLLLFVPATFLISKKMYSQF